LNLLTKAGGYGMTREVAQAIIKELRRIADALEKLNKTKKSCKDGNCVSGL